MFKNRGNSPRGNVGSATLAVTTRYVPSAWSRYGTSRVPSYRHTSGMRNAAYSGNRAKAERLTSISTSRSGGGSVAKFDAPTSFSVMAPAGVPKPIVQRLAAEVGKALKAVEPRLEQLALIPVYDTPEQFADSLRAERAKWSEFIKRKGITGE